MRAAIVPAIIAFVIVFAVGSNFRGASAPAPTATPFLAVPAMKCGVPEPECTILAQAFLGRIAAQNPGRTVISLTVVSSNSYEACFADGTCFGESGAIVNGGGVLPPGMPATDPPVPVDDAPGG